MLAISTSQIKAARALLDWSQEYLAAVSGLSIATISNMERGNLSLRSVGEVQRIFEGAGIEFLGDDGVRRCSRLIQTFDGVTSCEKFLDDMLRTLKEKGGDVIAVFKSQDMIARSLGVTPSSGVRQIKSLHDAAKMHFLVSEISDVLFLVPLFEFRTVGRRSITPVPYYVYGDKHALVIMEGVGAPRFHVMQSVSVTQSCRNHFLSLWNDAAPLPAQGTVAGRTATD